jgi:hypothetical protein
MEYILYYSNYCKHSQSVLQFLVKNNLIEKMNCICIDSRYKDNATGQMHIKLENGKTVLLPPNVHSVPSMLLIKNNFKAVVGDDILKFFQDKVETQNEIAMSRQGEPSAYDFNFYGGTNSIISEKYTYYNMSSDELSAKGKGNNRQMHNYMNANHQMRMMELPPENYKKEKMSQSITTELLEQQRNGDMNTKGNPFM